LDRYYLREMKKPIQFYRYQQYYGYGLATKFMDDITVIGHGGSLTGIANMMLFSPELEAGALVFCNTTGVPSAAIADAAMRLLNGRKLFKTPDFMDVEWSAETVEAALGFYRSDEDSTFEIYKKDGSVGLRLNDTEQAIRTVGKEMLLVAAPYAAADLILCRNSDGSVMGVRYGGRIIPKEERN
jgi:hypothetical protein